MNKEFKKWWESEALLVENPYEPDSPAYWAWEGWREGSRRERSECARICYLYSNDFGESTKLSPREREVAAKAADICQDAIRERGNK